MRPHASTEHIDWQLLAEENTKKLQQRVKEHGFDGIIIGSMNNIIWLTGVPMTADYPYFFSHIAVLSADAVEPVLLTPYVNAFFPEEAKWLKDVRGTPFTKEIQDPPALVNWHVEIAGALRNCGLAGKKVAVDPRLSIPLYEGIKKECPETEFASADRAMCSAREIKNDEELKALRQSCAIAEMGMEAGLSASRVGVTEREIAGEITRALFSSGATTLGFMPNIVAGERPGIMFSSGKFVRRNELVRVDISSVWNGYYSCIARTVFTGNPPAEVTFVYNALREAHEKGLEFIKPGVTNYQLYDYTKKAVEKLTQGSYSLPFFLGHGIGVSLIDEPWIFDSSSCEETELKEGMCFLFEPVVHVDGYGDAAITDCVAVTSSGAEVMTRTDRQLFGSESVK
jgi:Xaa-Pro aminopeptidase